MKKKQEIEEEIEEQPWHIGPIKIMIGLFLMLLIILMAFPYYGIKINPEPTRRITIAELNIEELDSSNQTYTFNELYKIRADDTQIKSMTNIIASHGCDSSRVCQAKAVYYFVRDNINYVRDPFNTEYIEDPKEILKSGGADCESGSILLATLEKAIGIESQLVIISEHAYLRILLPEAASKYKIEDDWVYLDWTCEECSFGEVPWQDLQKKASYINV